MNQTTEFSNKMDDDLNSVGSVENLIKTEKKTLDKKTLLPIIGVVAVGLGMLGGIGYYAYSNLATGDTSNADKTVSVAKPIENSGDGAQDALTFNKPQDTGLPPGMPVNVVADAQPAPLDPAAQQAAQAEQAKLAEAEQLKNNRYKSSIVIQGGSGTSVISDGSDPSTQKQIPPELQGIFGSMMGGQNAQNQAQQEKQQQASVSSQGGRFGAGSNLAPSANARYINAREYKIMQGKVIHATLLTAVKSDIPGQIIAQVSEPVYGEQGRYQLLPAGTRLFGEYSSMVRYGQAEIAATWRRAITPQGVEIMLDSPSANGLGIAGIGGGKVNNHFLQTFGTAGLLSLIGVGAELTGAKAQDQNNSIANVRNAVYESFQQSAENMLKSRQNIPPTITVEYGSNIIVIVAKDLDFAPLFSD